jgi:uncharacterized membrane protein
MPSGQELNLKTHRAPQSVWDKRGWRGVTIEERLGPWLVAAAGISVTIAGVRQRSWRGLIAACGGLGMIACVAAGLCNPRHATVRLKYLRRGHSAIDEVARVSMESFPASDAPSFAGAGR